MKDTDSKKKNNKVIGNLGEIIAAEYLKNNGFSIIQRNYQKKWGEIDIVTRRTDKIHFIEVKTVSYETKEDLRSNVSRDTWRPEDKMSPFKLKNLSRAIESWILENNYEREWQIDVVAVKLVTNDKYATIKLIENITL